MNTTQSLGEELKDLRLKFAIGSDTMAARVNAKLQAGGFPERISREDVFDIEYNRKEPSPAVRTAWKLSSFPL